MKRMIQGRLAEKYIQNENLVRFIDRSDGRLADTEED